MMCGIPIITNIAHDIVEKNECGLIVEYNSVQQIKNALAKLTKNKELRKRFGDNGRKAYLEKYSWKIMEQKLYRIYGDILQR
jgi:glycosyltransferase involved in cell wall biosynthesis